MSVASALLGIRDATDLRAPHVSASWREVDAVVRQRVARLERDPDRAADMRQRALVTVMRSVQTLRAATDAEASEWLWRVCRGRVIDESREGQRSRLISISRLRRHSDLGMDGFEGEPPAVPAGPAIEAVIRELERHVEAVARGRTNPTMAVVQARAAIDGLLLEMPAEEIAPGRSRDVAYKWVERGRPVVAAAAARWAASAESEAEEAIALALGELVARRRVTFGQARPARRKSA